MSIYFGMSAILVGATQTIKKVHELILDDELHRRSEAFRCKEIGVGREGYSAILYRAGMSRYRPVSLGTLRSADANTILKGQEVCEYVYWFAESDQDAWNECEYKGTLVAKGSSERRGSLTRVDRIFEEACSELGVEAGPLFEQIPAEDEGEDPRGPEPRILVNNLNLIVPDEPFLIVPRVYTEHDDLPF